MERQLREAHRATRTARQRDRTAAATIAHGTRTEADSHRDTQMAMTLFSTRAHACLLPNVDSDRTANNIMNYRTANNIYNEFNS